MQQGFGNPGRYLTANNRFAQLLAQQKDPNNGTTGGGIASILQKAMMGYMMGKDQGQMGEADKAMMSGMTAEQWQPPEGEVIRQGGPDGPVMSRADAMANAAPAGGYEGGIAALRDLSDNPYAGRYARDLMAKQMGQQEKQQAFDQRRELIDYTQNLRNSAPLDQARMQAEALGLQTGTPEYDDFLRQKVMGGGPDMPSSVREYQFFNSLPPEQQQQFLTMKRANPYLKLGDIMGQPDPLNPNALRGQIPVGIAPDRKIDDGRVVTLPGVPGGPVRGMPQAAPPQGMADPLQMNGPSMGDPMQQMGAPQGMPPQMPPQAQNTPIQPPASSVSPGGIGVTELPPSPNEQRKMTKTAEQNAQRDQLKGMYGGVVEQDIDRALKMIEGNEVFTTGAAGQVLSVIPGTGARDVRGLIDTVKANVGFDRLQQMRDASPTGGALGQVSEFENRLLQATIGNLEQSQSAEQLKYNLQRVKDIYLDIVHGPGNRPKAGGGNSPPPSGGIKFLGFE